MGMPCQVNSILKLKTAKGYPAVLELGSRHEVNKHGYRIFPIDVPLCLVNEHWQAHADVVIDKLTWQQQTTSLQFRIVRVYETPFMMQ
ncbi:DUF2584 family protein [Leptolyngbya iicbica]|uniref:DUF2584 family protein n=2 Tax=Cyanophyceae TaxID=3028117 RepID=A0A4Q7E3Q3_9CYAN|nr:DUF2584 family protein [Leptolyngbya sp. LK]RZM77316.1 DUF2584 family protein [Leptolyngbya sp. LK]